VSLSFDFAERRVVAVEMLQNCCLIAVRVPSTGAVGEVS
jgi:hypothetical protein